MTENVLQEECDALNKVFFHYITTKRPFVSMKYAMTMDGKIATYTGASKWITGEIARNHVQRQRHRFRGIMVGVGTILADDPLLKMCIRDRGCIIDGMAFSVFRSPTVHIQPVALAVDLAILQNTCLLYTSRCV